jgi:SAM-dependent methyltransferase
MKPEIITLIECPKCRSTDIDLNVDEEDHREVRSGCVVCDGCHHTYPIRNGILYLYDELPKTVIQEKEQAAAHLAKRNKVDPVTPEWLLKLPILNHDELGLSRLLTFESAIKHASLSEKSVVLDFGCGTCWTTWRLARQAGTCIGMDISDHQMHGLGSFESYIQAGRPYFERIIGDLNQLSFRQGAFDLIFTSAAIHHAISVPHIFDRIFKLLKPGGIFIMINEPVCSIFKKDTILQQEAREHLDSIEQPYNIFQYRRFARWMGFEEQYYLEWFNYRSESFKRSRGLVLDIIKRAAVFFWKHPRIQFAFRKLLFALTVFFGADYGTRGWPLLGRISFFMVMKKN